MAYARARRSSGSGDFWPGYVDVLSTLLLVVTFLLSIFMLAQYYATQEVSGKDSALKRLERQISELTQLLALEKGKGKSFQDELAALVASLSTLRDENARLTGRVGIGEEQARESAARARGLAKELEGEKKLSKDALAKIDLLNTQLLALRRQIAALEAALEASESKDKESQRRIADLGRRLNVAL
ncbi:MAG: peptidoglycan-binding protein, partial [Hyphomicrobiaceae bacterium]|nr:peptidoglycan-binding protein [Hyphomicrobiaceae bacterium]